MSVMYPLAADGVFWTLQGEGALLGTPMAFIRLAGCSVGCPQCDTDDAVRERVSVDELLQRVRDVTPADFVRPWAWITGGEPLDHDLEPLSDGLHALGFSVALATSGTKRVPVNLVARRDGAQPRFAVADIRRVPRSHRETVPAMETRRGSRRERPARAVRRGAHGMTSESTRSLRAGQRGYLSEAEGPVGLPHSRAGQVPGNGSDSERLGG